jgi:hypothetical protein
MIWDGCGTDIGKIAVSIMNIGQTINLRVGGVGKLDEKRWEVTDGWNCGVWTWKEEFDEVTSKEH